MISRRGDFCDVDVPRASYVKRMRSEKHLEIKKQIDMVTEWLFKEEQSPNTKKFKKVHNPKTLKDIARDNNKLDDKELAEKIINPNYFTDEI